LKVFTLTFGVVIALSPAVLSADAPITPSAPPDDYYVQTWQEDDGLPRNTITAITQTPDGYLWLGTHFGLIRHDGVAFTTFGAEVRPELVRGQISNLKTDRAGRLWVGTGKGGILVCDDGWIHHIGAGSGLPHQTVYSMCEDKAGVMWVATGDGSISRITNGTTAERIGFLRDTKSGAAVQLVQDRHGDIWFSRGVSYGQLVAGAATNVVNFNSGLVHLAASHDGGIWVSVNRQLRKVNVPPDRPDAGPLPLPFGNYEIQKLYEDRSGTLWIGTRNLGLFRLNGDEVRQVLPTKNRILDIYEDAEGSLWVATEGGGLSKIRPRVFRVLTTPEGVASSKVLSVCEDQNGSLWAVPLVGGLLSYRTADSAPTVLPGSTNMGVATVSPDRAGGVWSGTVNRGLLHYDGENVERLLIQSPFRDRQMRVLYFDREDHLWIGLHPHGLARYDAAQVVWPFFYRDLGLSEDAIWAIAEDRDGAIWFGTTSGDVQRLKDGKIVSYTQADGLPGTSIGALYVDEKNTLWVGTMGGGLGCLQGGKFKFVSVNDGLYDNVISQVVEDDGGFLWLGSSRGIFRVRKPDLELFMAGRQSRVESIAYGKSDGMANVECTGGHQPSVWKTRAGRLCFATSKGIVYFDPAALPLNTRPPPLVLEAVSVDGQAIAWTNAIHLDWNLKSIAFNYTALSFIAPGKVHFRRQLVGFDTNWVEVGTSRSATYPRLQPGRYQFRFTACNNDGVWNEHPLVQTVIVAPAWWQTMWCRVLIVVCFASLVGGLVRYFSMLTIRRRLARLEQAHALEKERTRIARDIHDDVGARLTQMAYLSDLASSEIAEGLPSSGERLKEIVRASRQTVHALDEIVWAVNPQKDSLAHLLEYISQYANSFFRGTNIRCRQDLPASVPDWALPSEYRHHLFLAAKEALNNIQKHSQATEVWIRMVFHPPELELVIEDNGSGFAVKEGKASRDGLKNMNGRLAALGGTCQIASQTGQGTRLVMKVSLPKTDAK
jgi:ligand-binding sensor domain-containing protein/signal transduction histidine kinase